MTGYYSGATRDVHRNTRATAPATALTTPSPRPPLMEGSLVHTLQDTLRQGTTLHYTTLQVRESMRLSNDCLDTLTSWEQLAKRATAQVDKDRESTQSVQAIAAAEVEAILGEARAEASLPDLLAGGGSYRDWIDGRDSRLWEDSRHKDLNNRALIKHKSWKKHRERLGAIRLEGHFGGLSVQVTNTANNETLNSRDRVELVNSRLTAQGARFRRIGAPDRVTAKEYGSRRGRPHHHQVYDVSLESLVEKLQRCRGFAKFARTWQPDERAAIPMAIEARWEAGGCQGRRKGGRTRQELMVSRYLAKSWGLGYVDVQEIPAGAAVGYLLTYTGKGGESSQYGRARVSYSRGLSAPWAHGAHLQVYAYKGEGYFYPPRASGWAGKEVARLDRLDLWRDHERFVRGAERAVAIPSLLRSMARKDDYQAMTTASELRFKQSEVYESKAAAIRYRVEELESPDMERAAIIGEDES